MIQSLHHLAMNTLYKRDFCVIQSKIKQDYLKIWKDLNESKVEDKRYVQVRNYKELEIGEQIQFKDDARTTHNGQFIRIITDDKGIVPIGIEYHKMDGKVIDTRINEYHFRKKEEAASFTADLSIPIWRKVIKKKSPFIHTHEKYSRFKPKVVCDLYIFFSFETSYQLRFSIR